MANEIKILVRTQNSTKAGMQEVDKAVDDLAKKSAGTFAGRFSQELTQKLQTSMAGDIARIGEGTESGARAAGDHIGRVMSERITERITRDVNGRLRDSRGRFVGGGSSTSSSRSTSGGDRDSVHVDVDVDRQSLLSRFSGLGKQAAARFGSAFQTATSAIFSGDVLSTAIKVGLVGLAGTVLAPVIGGAITSGVLVALGGGAIGAGVAAAFRDPRIQTAAKGTLDKLKKLWEDFGSNFKGPVEDFFAPGKGEGSGLTSVIDQITPMVKEIGVVFGPLTKDLGKGVIGMLQNMLPGILRAVKASEPLIKVLADNLPGLGDEIGKFFDHMKNGAPDAAQFFNDFLGGVKLLIRFVGNLIEIFTRMYSIVRPIIVGLATIFMNSAGIILNAAAIAFGWMPGLGPRLQGLTTKFNRFRDDTLRGLREIDNEDPTITIRFRVLGQAAARAAVRTAQLLDGMGYAHGGVRGAFDGGARSGLTWVGEQGPELVKLPAGSQVHTAGDSRRLAGQSGGGSQFVGRIGVDRSGLANRDLIDGIVRALRIEIFNISGGNVQQALGQ